MNENTLHNRAIDPAKIDQLKDELNELDHDSIILDGGLLKPSQCYRYELDPFHIMYNTNCPDSLKEKVEGILKKYTKESF